MRFGIICAMPEEIKELTAKLSDKQEKKIGGKSYLFGKINNQDVVLVESGIGKVEAGITTEHLITDCGADVVINSGSAGGIGYRRRGADEPRVPAGQRLPRGRGEAQHGARADPPKRAEAEGRLFPRPQDG